LRRNLCTLEKPGFPDSRKVARFYGAPFFYSDTLRERERERERECVERVQIISYTVNMKRNIMKDILCFDIFCVSQKMYIYIRVCIHIHMCVYIYIYIYIYMYV